MFFFYVINYSYFDSPIEKTSQKRKENNDSQNAGSAKIHKVSHYSSLYYVTARIEHP